jgi:hypothetical protein
METMLRLQLRSHKSVAPAAATSAQPTYYAPQLEINGAGVTVKL